MTIKELNKEELFEVVKIYEKERNTCPWLCSLEEFVENFIRKCESCGKLVSVYDSDEDLKIGTNFKGESYHCCDNCYEDSIEYENSKIEEEYEII